ncbi:MAG: orotate phosphoribosyltransferase [Candidatus Doudnabacteria bacterium RIFCSPHIGHO2_01_FULL_43_23]|uniref:Orotate phosphoribosyltransferase n=1 Tax=Candidatus Doudnabacteria bacterium RIFCSPHIGHO2_01_FULL_43_23 TaxID=1817822 RepID=A0A1F5NVF9_9BACT|nr:MAG: orotate phosphoribosyltransferase [Candidatus Doudnabacteria bacterium RIFCSPHIGHO2_01_FULL_43_23]
MNKENLIKKLYDIGGLKFGAFKLKTGLLSPFYIDLRVTVSYPEILKTISDLMWNKVKNLKFDFLCGIPYTALPFATIMSVENTVPMIMKRKELKGYGTNKLLEGVFEEGKTCLLVDDMITNGLSKFESIKPIEEAGLKVQDIVVLLDRQQGGPENLKKKGYNLVSVFTVTEAVDLLLKVGKIDQKKYEIVINFIKDNQMKE